MFCNKGDDSIVMAEKKKNVFQRTEICKGLQCCILYSSPLPIVPPSENWLYYSSFYHGGIKKVIDFSQQYAPPPFPLFVKILKKDNAINEESVKIKSMFCTSKCYISLYTCTIYIYTFCNFFLHF